MKVPVNPFKKAIAEQRLQIGLWQALANPYSAEICAGSGVDWLLFDGEHAPNDIPTLLRQLHAVAGSPVHPIARPPVGDVALIKQYLDIGFTTLLVPLVETAEQAALLARAVRYPPAGIRGVGAALARASQWSRVTDYLAEADSQICLLVQVESLSGLNNLDEIAATKGVDGVFIGPADLAASMGHRGHSEHPDVMRAIEDGIARIRAAGKAPGIIVREALIQRFIDLGCLFIAVGSDVGILAKGTTLLAERWKPKG